MNKVANIIKNKENTFTNIDYLNPDNVYIPIDKDYEIVKNVGDYLYKGDVILKNKNESIYSTISGTIVGKTDSMKLNNKKVECIVIENDFKEKTKKRKGCIKYINIYSKDELISLINKYNGTQNHIDTTKPHIIINGIDKDPYEKTISYIINTHCSKILETIDALSEILDVKSTTLVVSNKDNNNVVNLTNNIGTYPNINLKLISYVYPIGFKNVLTKKILTKKQKEEGYIYLDIEDIYNIYNILKKKKPITEKYITLSGNSIEQDHILNVKIGSSLSELIKNVCKITNNKYYVIENGLISSKTLTTLNTIITRDTRSIFLNTKDESTEKKCINCGLCMKKCPVGLNPKYIKEHKKADKSKCISCGLCTYICPSKINFKKYLGDNHE